VTLSLACLLGTVLLVPSVPVVGKEELRAVEAFVRFRTFHPAIILTVMKIVTRNQREEQPTGEEDGIVEP
jgi:hypothetical protein